MGGISSVMGNAPIVNFSGQQENQQMIIARLVRYHFQVEFLCQARLIEMDKYISKTLYLAAKWQG